MRVGIAPAGTKSATKKSRIRLRLVVTACTEDISKVHQSPHLTKAWMFFTHKVKKQLREESTPEFGLIKLDWNLTLIAWN